MIFFYFKLEKTNRLIQRDSKIPSALFGNFRELKRINSIADKPQNIENSSHTDDFNSQNINFRNTNDQTNSSNKKVARRYSSFNPQIINKFSFASGANHVAFTKRNNISSSKADLGMNIFSNNFYNNYTLENSFKDDQSEYENKLFLKKNKELEYQSKIKCSNNHFAGSDITLNNMKDLNNANKLNKYSDLYPVNENTKLNNLGQIDSSTFSPVDNKNLNNNKNHKFIINYLNDFENNPKTDNFRYNNSENKMLSLS